MKFELIRELTLSGRMAGIYTVRVDDDPETLLERFVRENLEDHEEEILDILRTIETIGHDTGARDTFFKPYEGKPGDGVEALFEQDSKPPILRQYCIRYGRVAVVMGGGGPKPRNIRSWQDNPKLSRENLLIQKISATITAAIRERDLRWSADGTELLGNLTLDTEDYR